MTKNSYKYGMDDMFRAALIALCKAEGRHKNVADKIKSNPDYLKQIISGTALPSKRERGVGPGLRRKLSEAYPGWLTLATDRPQEAPASQTAHYGEELQFLLGMGHFR